MKRAIKFGIIAVAVASLSAGCLNQNDTGSSQPSNRNEVQGQKPSVAAANIPWIASKNTTRINRDDPFEAAVLVSNTLWMATSDDNRPEGVILVDPKEWQTAVVGADLVHHPNNGPLLFVNKDGVPEVTLNELKRLKPKGAESNNGVQVILVGNLDQRVEDQVKEIGLKPDRIAGGSPAAVAKAVDAYYANIAKDTPASVIVGSMDSMEYTMPAANWIAHMPEPLLFVKKNEIPQETVDALKTRDGKANIYVLGPESVISAQVEQQLGKYGKVVRIWGKDPYDNAVAFAKYKDPSTGFGWGITTPGHNLSFVNKDSAALAIAAAPFSHLGKHAPLLWTDKDQLPGTVMAYVMSVQPKYDMSPTEGPYNHAWLTGSENSLTAAVQGEIDSMMEIVSRSGEDHAGMGHAGG